MSQYDVLLQGGTLYDPCTGTMEPCDLGIKNGKIAARGKGLPGDADTVMDVTGLIVAPGLIDMHCHVYPVFPYQMADGLRTVNAEGYMFRAGVTTAVDAGTTGWRNLGTSRKTSSTAPRCVSLRLLTLPQRECTIRPPSKQWRTSIPKLPPPWQTPGRM